PSSLDRSSTSLTPSVPATISSSNSLRLLRSKYNPLGKNSFRYFDPNSVFTLHANGIKTFHVVLSTFTATSPPSDDDDPLAAEKLLVKFEVSTNTSTATNNNNGSASHYYRRSAKSLPADVRWLPSGVQIRNNGQDSITCHISIPKNAVDSHPGIQITSRYGSLRIVGEIGAIVPPLTVSSRNSKIYLSILESTKLTLSGCSGDMLIRDVTCRGRLTLACLDGVINVEHTSATEAYVETKCNDLIIRQAAIGKIALQTQSGNILLEALKTMRLCINTPLTKWMGEWACPTSVAADASESHFSSSVCLSVPALPFRIFIAERYLSMKLNISGGPFHGILDMKSFRGSVSYSSDEKAELPVAYKTIDLPRHKQVFFGSTAGSYCQFIDWNSHGGKAQ
ncbi:hypothetical protein EV182_004982, partial [Spiromyces aspiralis]